MICKVCQNQVKGRAKKYCSRKCYWKDKIGNVKPNSGQFKKGESFWRNKKRPEVKKWLSMYKEGHRPWNEGLEYANLNRLKLIDENKYKHLHYWVGKKLGKPMKCEKCGKENMKRYHWANISGKYKKELSDWMRLCVSCHFQMDKSQKRGVKLHVG